MSCGPLKLTDFKCTVVHINNTKIGTSMELTMYKHPFPNPCAFENNSVLKNKFDSIYISIKLIISHIHTPKCKKITHCQN